MKNYNLSMIRLTALYAILFCHIFEQNGFTVLGNYLAVGVQIFLLLSGYLYSQKSFDEPLERINFIIKNFIKILVNYYVCVILFFIPVYYVLEPEMINLGNIFHILTCSGTWWGVHHLWYIPYCLLCYLITPSIFDLSRYINNRKKHIVVLCFVCAIIQIVMYAFKSYFMASLIICYILGYFIHKIKTTKQRMIVFAIISCFAFTTSIIRYFYVYIWTSYNFTFYEKTMLTLIDDYSRVFLGLFIFLFIIIIGEKIKYPQIMKNILDKNDKLSYDIYLVHMIFVKGCLSIVGKLDNFVLEVFLIILLSIVMAKIIHFISELLKCKVIPKIRIA